MNRLPFILLLIATGCAAEPHEVSTAPLNATASCTELILSPDVYSYGDTWLIEARTRFPDPFIVYCHGGSDYGQWWLSPRGHRDFATVESIAIVLHAMMPNRDIVFIACNQGGEPLNVPRCWHARRIVSSVPQSGTRLPVCPFWCASIGEFVCDAR